MPMTDVQDQDLRERFAPAVLANELQLASGWGQPCLGYLLLFRPDAAASAVLTAVQDQVQALEPELLRQPVAALHSSVGFLVPVNQPVAGDKDEIWRRNGARWVAAIEAARRAGPARMRLRYRRLVATDAAIIAVADTPSPITRLRQALAPGLGLPWPLAKGPLVHVSLFRYRQPLRDPAALLRALATLDFTAETEVSELLAVRETTFPSLEYEVLHRL
jgi:hypothetical protein